jgi:hypothetical protein
VGDGFKEATYAFLNGDYCTSTISRSLPEKTAPTAQGHISGVHESNHNSTAPSTMLSLNTQAFYPPRSPPASTALQNIPTQPNPSLQSPKAAPTHRRVAEEATYAAGHGCTVMGQKHGEPGCFTPLLPQSQQNVCHLTPPCMPTNP